MRRVSVMVAVALLTGASTSLAAAQGEGEDRGRGRRDRGGDDDERGRRDRARGDDDRGRADRGPGDDERGRADRGPGDDERGRRTRVVATPVTTPGTVPPGTVVVTPPAPGTVTVRSPGDPVVVATPPAPAEVTVVATPPAPGTVTVRSPGDPVVVATPPTPGEVTVVATPPAPGTVTVRSPGDPVVVAVPSDPGTVTVVATPPAPGTVTVRLPGDPLPTPGTVNIAVPLPPGAVVDLAPPGEDREERRRWRRERIERWHADPVVDGFSPHRGAPGTEITVHGDRLHRGLEILLAGRPVPAAQVTPHTITFIVPEGAESGLIELRRRNGESLVVGNFRAARDRARARAAFAAFVAAERARVEDAQREAQTVWQSRRGQLAAAREARLEAMRLAEVALEQSRAERRLQQLAAVRAQWEQAFLQRPDVLSELAFHAEREARLARMQRLADVEKNDDLAVRIEMLVRREASRHGQRMTDLRAALGQVPGVVQ